MSSRYRNQPRAAQQFSAFERAASTAGRYKTPRSPANRRVVRSTFNVVINSNQSSDTPAGRAVLEAAVAFATEQTFSEQNLKRAVRFMGVYGDAGDNYNRNVKQVEFRGDITVERGDTGRVHSNTSMRIAHDSLIHLEGNVLRDTFIEQFNKWMNDNASGYIQITNAYVHISAQRGDQENMTDYNEKEKPLWAQRPTFGREAEITAARQAHQRLLRVVGSV